MYILVTSIYDKLFGNSWISTRMYQIHTVHCLQYTCHWIMLWGQIEFERMSSLNGDITLYSTSCTNPPYYQSYRSIMWWFTLLNNEKIRSFYHINGSKSNSRINWWSKEVIKRFIFHICPSLQTLLVNQMIAFRHQQIWLNATCIIRNKLLYSACWLVFVKWQCHWYCINQFQVKTFKDSLI